MISPFVVRDLESVGQSSILLNYCSRSQSLEMQMQSTLLF